ncbi:MAG: cytochrome c-type biogenesis CcmF C-terminal domain-containing protein, partial [Planctomycetota bacterium]
FFLVVLLACLAASVGVVIWRRDLLRGERPLERLISREGAFTAGNALLVVILLTTMIGTIFPLISKPFAGKAVLLDENFYNRVVLPMAVLLAMLMGFGPVLKSGSQRTRLRGRLIVPAIALHAAAVLAGIWSGRLGGDRSAATWMAFCGGASTFIVACILQDIVLAAAARLRTRNENILVATLQSLWVGRRRYGGYLAHVGMALIVVGVAASSLHDTEADLRLAPGESAKVGRYTVRFDSLAEIHEANYLAGQAKVIVVDTAGGETVLSPEVRQYSKSEKRNTEVDVHSNLLEDVYVVLAGWKNRGEQTHLRVTVKPLVIWIWIGSITMAVGGVVCLLPSSRRGRGRAEDPGSAEEARDAGNSPAARQPVRDLAEAPL